VPYRYGGLDRLLTNWSAGSAATPPHHLHWHHSDAQGPRNWYERVILALSDQQLFIGFAMIFATLLIRCKLNNMDLQITAFTFAIATCCAVFACTVHFICLTAMAHYFHAHKRLRTVRVLIMFASVVLIVPFILDVQVFDDYTVNVRCAIQNTPGALFGNLVLLEEVVIYFQMVFVIIGGFARRVVHLYCWEDLEGHPYTWQFLFLQCLNWKKKHDIHRAIKLRQQRLDDKAARVLPGSSNMRSRLFIVTQLIPVEINGSLFADMIWLSFYITFGFAIMIDCLIVDKAQGHAKGIKVHPVSFSPTFGQLMPLALLGLPLLAALESFVEDGDDKHGTENHAESNQEQQPPLGEVRLSQGTSAHSADADAGVYVNPLHRTSEAFDLALTHHPRFTRIATAVLCVLYLLAFQAGAVLISGIVGDNDALVWQLIAVTIVLAALLVIWIINTISLWRIVRRMRRTGNRGGAGDSESGREGSERRMLNPQRQNRSGSGAMENLEMTEQPTLPAGEPDYERIPLQDMQTSERASTRTMETPIT
jgi:hypothetical protein